MEEERRGGNDVAAHHLGQPVKPSLLERLAGRGEKAEKLTARRGCAARRRRCGALWGGGDDDAAGSESCLVQRLRSDDDHLVIVVNLRAESRDDGMIGHDHDRSTARLSSRGGKPLDRGCDSGSPLWQLALIPGGTSEQFHLVQPHPESTPSLGDGPSKRLSVAIEREDGAHQSPALEV